MAIRTINLNEIIDQVGNLYEGTVIMSKRARQIATNQKAELDEKLSYFEGFEPDLDDRNEDQLRVSLEYEVKPKPTEQAIDEMLGNEIYYRNPHTDE